MSSSLQSPTPGSSHGPPASSTAKRPSKLRALFRNNLKWDCHKDAIRVYYIEEDHTLKETMDFILESCHFKASERKWKDKLKEWGFEKNIPAKEMSFMAAKSIKRKFEEAKDTIFYRGGTLVDESKVEEFKKRRVGDEYLSVQSAPETPPQVTYSTPKPQSPNPSPNEADNDLEKAAKHGLSLAGVDAETNKTHTFNVSSNRQLVLREAPLIDDGHPASTHVESVIGRDQRICDWRLEVLEHENDDNRALVSMTKAFMLARSLRDTKQRENTEIECIDAIIVYIMFRCGRNEKALPLCVLESYMTKLLAYLENPDDGSIWLSARHVLNFYDIEPRWIHPTITRSIDSTLCKLLQRHWNLKLTESTLSMMLADFQCRSENDPLRLAFRTALENLFSAEDSRNQEVFRFMMVSLAWTLDVGPVRIRFTTRSPSFSRIKEVATQLRDISIDVVCTITPIRSILLVLKFQDENELGTRTYSTVLENAGLLASSCSVEGMHAEAEAMFSTIRKDRNWRLLSSSPTSKITTLFLYCRHLKRQERGKELFAAIKEIRGELGRMPYSVNSTFLEDIRWVRSAMKDLSGENLSAKEMRQWHGLDRQLKYFEAGTGTLVVRSSPSTHSEILEFDMEKEDQNLDVDDCKSTNAYGVTYTESGISGISFNYSDLWK
ncbi:uncharacterized protein PAC_06159 [Phialocephala subalpina]|uniref:Clr5 domain-containing protein n=1 Tax=Phialocephala subalpina TaxID=576137 RepID=A0A1L7WU20_9HELO|nr:uncharacterized protein PAC_06159 [Phialocephala subalpina]